MIEFLLTRISEEMLIKSTFWTTIKQSQQTSAYAKSTIEIKNSKIVKTVKKLGATPSRENLENFLYCIS